MVTRVHCDICDDYETAVIRRSYHIGYHPKDRYSALQEPEPRKPIIVEFDLCLECEVEILRFMLRDQLSDDIMFQERLVKIIRGKIAVNNK